MLDPESQRVLALMEPRRYVALSRAEAAELGTDVLLDFDAGIDDGWVVSVTGLAAYHRDAMRWRRLVHWCARVGLGLLVGGALTGLLVVVSVVVGRVS